MVHGIYLMRYGMYRVFQSVGSIGFDTHVSQAAGSNSLGHTLHGFGVHVCSPAAAKGGQSAVLNKDTPTAHNAHDTSKERLRVYWSPC